MGTREFATSKDGLKIRYEIRGAGAPLALIMGFSGSGRAWSERFLGMIEKHFRTIVIDNRGTGESDKPDQPWTLGDMAADAAAVLEHAGVARAHIYGISMGGMIAQEFALAFPGRVHGLVLGCTNCGASHSIPAKPEDVAKLVPQPGMNPVEQARMAFSAACGKAFLASSEGQAFLESQLIEQAKYPVTPMHTYQRQMEAIMGFDTFARLGAIKAPTLIIHGDDDAIVPVANAEVLRGAIPGARVHILHGAGHMFFWEQAGESVSAPAAFLSALK
jgi:pimeloyl-ACP methyl ester carboxylesterase